MTGTTAADGRRQRSQRSRKALIDAALALIDQGNLVPTAQQVAERAGVGVRSFFRHFEDMECFFRAVDGELRGLFESLMPGGDRAGSLAERIERAVLLRAQVYETLRNIILSTHAQLWRYDLLRRNYRRYQRALRKDLDAWIPELAALPLHRHEAVDAMVSFEVWHRLREQQGLGRKATTDVLVDMMQGLVIE
jgi:AcrR family transcriptional regulator